MATMLVALLLAKSEVRSIPAAPAQPPAVLRTTPAIDPWGVQFDLPSKISGRTYRIYVSRPNGPPPKGGWPVVYVLDGDISFSTVASQNSLRPAVHKNSALVVGIGYPDATAAMSLRTRDFTPSVPSATVPVGAGNEPARAENNGGADQFHRFMIEELRPALAAAYSINATDQTLMGYSLG